MSALNDWDVTDANNNAAPPDGWPENTMQYSEVNNTGRAVQGTLKRFFADVNGSLNGAGIANAYTLTLNEPYVAYFDGMYFACSIPASNTGAVTIDVNAIGVQSVLNRDGTALIGSELDNGGIYEFRYDGTNFQLMGTIGSAIGTAQATLSNSNTPDLVDTDVALRVGAADPDTAQHIEIGPQGIQSKSDDTTATNLRLQEAGGFAELWGDGNPRVVTANANTHFRSNTNTDAEQRRILGTHQDGTVRWFLGHNGDDTLELRNQIDGANLRIRVNDNVGTARLVLDAEPDGDTDLYHPNTGDLRMAMQAGGIAALRSDGNLDTEDRQLSFQHADGTERGSVGWDSSSLMAVRNEIDSAQVALYGRDSGSALSIILVGDPDGDLDLYGNGILGMSAVDRTAAGALTGGEIIDSVANPFPIGFNVIPGRTISGSVTMDDDFIGRLWEKTAGGSIIITLPVDANIPNGATIMVANLDTETLAVNVSGTTLEWLDGSGATVTGNRTVAALGSIVSIRKRNSTNFQIWGNGIS